MLIVDDHPAVPEALSGQISRHSDLKVCGEAADLAHALKLVDSLSRAINHLSNGKFDMAVLDINLPDSTGLRTYSVLLHDQYQDVPIVVRSGDEDRELAMRATTD